MKRNFKRAQQTRVYVIERRAFYAALSCVLVLSGAYVYFVSAAVAHVVVRKELSQDIRATELRISELESIYMETKNSIDEAAALGRGFEENEDRVFVTKKAANVALVTNDES